MRPQVSRTQSEQRGRSATKRNTDQGELKWDYHFRPAEIVKNIQKSSSNSSLTEKSRSREGSIVQLKEFDPYNNNKTRSHSAATINYKPTPSRLNPSKNFKNPMSAYSSHDTIDTVVPNHTNILYQKYHRPSPTVNNETPSRFSDVSTPKSRKSVALPKDLLPAFEDVKIDMDDDYKDDEDQVSEPFNGLDLSEFDNKFTNSNPNSIKDDSEKSSINSSESNKAKTVADASVTTQQRPEKYGRIQQRVNFMKQFNDESEKPMSQRWTSQTFHQKLFLESLNNDLRSLKRSNHNPLYNTLKRTEHIEHKIIDSAASVSSNKLLKTLDLDSNSSPKKETSQITKSYKCDVDRLKKLLPKCHEITKQLWSDQNESLPQVTTFKKPSAGTIASSYDSSTVNIVTHTFHPKEADIIQENFDGYVIDNATSEETYIRVKESEPQAPNSQKLVHNIN